RPTRLHPAASPVVSGEEMPGRSFGRLDLALALRLSAIACLVLADHRRVGLRAQPVPEGVLNDGTPGLAGLPSDGFDGPGQVRGYAHRDLRGNVRHWASPLVDRYVCSIT